jgi:hypothetical protein
VDWWKWALMGGGGAVLAWVSWVVVPSYVRYSRIRRM